MAKRIVAFHYEGSVLKADGSIDTNAEDSIRQILDAGADWQVFIVTDGNLGAARRDLKDAWTTVRPSEYKVVSQPPRKTEIFAARKAIRHVNWKTTLSYFLA